MTYSQKILFKEFNINVAKAIKESCYQTDARVYNIANQLSSSDSAMMRADFPNLIKEIERILKEAIDVGCNLSVIIKGIMIGSFRSASSGGSKFSEQSKDIHAFLEMLIRPMLVVVKKSKGDLKQSGEGFLASVYIIASENKLNVQESLKAIKEYILLSAGEIDPAFAENIKNALPNLDNAP